MLPDTLNQTFTLGDDILTNSGGDDVFIAAFDNAGNVIKASSVTGGTLEDRGNSIAIDLYGNPWVSGYFKSASTTFNTTTLNNADANPDLFIAKHSWFIKISEVPTTCGCNRSLIANNYGGTAPFTYLWNDPLGQTSQTATGLCAGTYTVTVTDFNGGAVIDSITVSDVNIAVTTSNPKCDNASNGSINLTVSGGTTPYSFLWSNGALTEDISGLTQGTYTVTVSDANLCETVISRTLTDPDITILFSPVSPSCYEGTDGKINTSVINGLAPYTYLWSNGATSKNLTDIPAGSYSLTVTDANGCIIIENTSVSDPQPITETIQVTNPTCNAGSNGSVNLTVSGGTPPYTYLWSSGQTTQDISSLNAGKYYVTIKDSKLCTSIDSAEVTNPAEIILAFSVFEPTCFGYSDGSIIMMVSNGQAPYSYIWSTGATTKDISSVATGRYYVTVTDNKGCIKNDSIDVSQPTQLVASTVGTYLTCYQNASGAVNASVLGGTSPYTYFWSNGATSEDLSGLAIGTYTVTITDNKNCNSSSTTIITQPSLLTANIAGTNVTCNGLSDGQANLTVLGGTTPYSYLWDDVATSTSEDLSNISAGTYNVTLIDANGCQATASIEITQPALLNASIAGSNVTCNGLSNGIANLTVSGGTTPYSFEWDDITSSTIEDISDLTPDSYNVTVTDANSCQVTASVVITQPDVLTAGIVGTNILCNGASTGAANLTVSGGTTPYIFNWSNGASSEDLSNTAAGTYVVTVTDANNCQVTANIVITQPDLIVASIVGTNVSCNGLSDGQANLTVSGGTTPYSYLWDDIANSTSEDLSNISAGTYNVTVNDANACPVTTSIVISEPALLNASIVSSNVTCNGLSTGTANLSVSGGTTPYSFIWDDTANSTTEDLSNLPIGTYNVTVTDANNCQVNANVVITQPDVLTANIVGTNILCNGASTGTANLTVSGGTTPYSFIWNNAAITEDLSNITAGTYEVTVTDANSCQITTSVLLTQPTALTTSIIGINETCNTGIDGEADLTISGGVSPYTILWSNGETTEDISGLASGTYTATVTDANACTSSSSITIYDKDITLIFNTTAPSCFDGNDGKINLSVINGDAPYSYLWSNGQTTKNITGLNPGSYSVTVTDVSTCEIIESVSVENTLPIAHSLIATNPKCFDGNDGSINLAVSGGTAPYSYLWSNAATTKNIANLSAGRYIVTITDNKLCTSIDSIDLINPSKIFLDFSTFEPSCFGYSDGNIIMMISNGTAPYTYNWSNGSITKDLYSITSDEYFVTATDANNCQTTDSVIIDEPTELTLSAIITNLTCYSNSTGSINLTAAGGTIPYSYFWSNGTTTEDLTNIPFGNFTVTVTDHNSCKTSLSNLVTQPDELSASISGTDITCNGLNDGIADLTVNGGTLPYSYLWSNTETTEDISGLSSNTYSVTITDINSCQTNASVVISQPAVLNASIAGTNVTCNGLSNGGANLTVTGGTTPFTYIWDDLASSTTEDLSDLSIGTYSVTITDANGCSANASVTIGEPTVLTATATGTEVLCNGGTTTVTVSANGGTSPYTNSGDYTVSAGTHNYTITDANGCSANASVTIGEPTVLTASATGTDVICNGGTTTVTVSANGGTSPYTNTGDYTVSASTHNYTVTDANGCSANTSIDIIEPTVLTATATGTDVLCNGGTTTVTVSANGGTSPYTNTGNYTVSSGTHNYTVTDANGCTANTSVTINEPTALTASATGADVLCNGGTTTVMVLANGGTSPYTNTGNYTVSAGTHNYTVTDANGCSANASVTISEPTALTASATGADVLCNGGTTTVMVSANGGTSPYTNTGNYTVSVGTHNYTITDANGCSVNASVTINEPTALTASASGADVICNGGTTTVTVSANGGTSPYTNTGNYTVSVGTHNYTITDANGCSVNASVTINEPTALTASASGADVLCNGGTTTVIVSANGGTSSYTNTGNFTVSAGTHNYTITDANGCTANTSVTINEPTALTASATGADVLCNGGTTTVMVLANGGTSPYTNTGNYTVSAGTHNYTVTDANGCSANASVTISEPTALTASATGADVLCNGGTTTVMVLANGGTSPYTNTDNYTVSAGTHNYTVTDANGCSANASVTISEPTALTATATGADVLCNGGTTTVMVLANGGTSPYTNTGNYTVSAGTHNYTVTDANGCSANASVTINEPTALTASATGADVLCNGGTTTVTVSANGGTSPYTNTGDYTVSAGTHNYTITDANGCSANASVTISEPTALTASASGADVLCNGGTTTVTVSANGGASPYTNTGDYTVSAGTHNYTITDANGCSANASVTISEPTVLTATASGTDVLCNGGTTTVTVSANGGTSPYTNTGDYTVSAGTHNYTITDANGCSANASVTISEPTAIIANSIISNVNCNGNSTGSIELTISGASSPYTFAWSNGETTENIFSLVAGSYVVTITDAISCTNQFSFVVSEPTQLHATISGTNALCENVANGSANLSVTGGLAAYDYLWSNGSTDEDLTNLLAGVYSVTVTDSNTCETTAIVTITAPSNLLVLTTQNVSCPDTDNGSVQCTVINGATPYSYVWSNGETSRNISNLTDGTYIVTVTDNNGCILVDSATIYTSNPLSSYYTVQNPSCFNGNDGSINLTVIGGTQPYSYLWSNGATTQDLTETSAGTYYVTISDFRNCQFIDSMIVTNPASIQLYSTIMEPDCNGNANGSVILMIGNGTAPYSYTWQHGSTSKDLFNILAGMYYVTVTDANNCLKVDSVEVEQPELLILTSALTHNLCFGENNGTIDIIVSGGTTPYYYSWNNGGSSESLNALAASNYSVTVTDANNCTISSSVDISQPDELISTINKNNISCNGLVDGEVDLTISGGTLPYTYIWSNGLSDEDISGLDEGMYYVTVSDINGCTLVDSTEISNPEVLSAIETITNISCFGNNDGTISLSPNGGTAPYTYLWDNGANSELLNGLSAGNYSVTVSDANSCTVFVDIEITEPNELTVSLITTNIDCNAAATEQ
jgi:hypothetical protein